MQRRSFIKACVSAGLGWAATCALAVPAQAQSQSIRVEVRSIAASKEGTSVDAALSDIAQTLNVTFAGYTTFEQLGRQSVTVSRGGSENISLPNGKAMTLTFNGFGGDVGQARAGDRGQDEHDASRLSW